MRCLITADWHLSVNPRDAYRFHFVETALPALLRREKVGLLLFLGDVTEIKDGHDAVLVNRIVAVFETLSKICPIICLQGNHDFLASPSSPFFEFLSKLQGERIHWVRVPTPLAALKNVPAAFQQAERTILLPYSANCERDWDNVALDDYDWAFAHQCFTGARSDSGFELSGVPLSIFPPRLQVVSGDIHKPQELGQLTYVGSPYAVDFGDCTETRTLLWDGITLKSLPYKGPQKRLFSVGDVRTLDDIDTVQKGDILKIRVSIDSPDEWPDTRKRIQAWADARGYTLHQALPTVSARTVKRQETSTHVRSDEEAFQRFAEAQQLPQKYVVTGRNLL